MKQRKLADHIELIHLMLIREDPYRSYLEAVYDEHAVEGSLAMDNAMASQIIRDKAREIGRDEVATQQLATILTALKVVLRRYGTSREERRQHGTADFVVTPSGEANPKRA